MRNNPLLRVDKNVLSIKVNIFIDNYKNVTLSYTLSDILNPIYLTVYNYMK